MTSLAKNNFDRSLIGIEGSFEVTGRFAQLAIRDGENPLEMASKIYELSKQLGELASIIRAEGMDPYYDSKQFHMSSESVGPQGLGNSG